MKGIYGIRNIKNQRVYIGKSIHLEKRKRTHFSELRKGKHGNKPLQNAFNKYGEENFVFEILLRDDSLEDDELYHIEKIYILLFETDRHKKGYNIALGGKGGYCEWTPEQRKARSIKYSGKGNPFYGKTHSKETIKKKVANTDYSFTQTPEYRAKLSKVMKGRVFSEEHSRNKSLAQMGGKNPMAKAVSINGVTYETMTLAAKELGLNHSTVGSRVNSDSKRFEHWTYVDKKNIPYEKVVEYSNGANKKKCLIDGIEYESIKSASDTLKIPPATLRRRLLSDKFPNYSYVEKQTHNR